jgi:outer membrane receptor protein involved in Fe transport
MRTHETMRWLTGVRKKLGEVDMDASITYTNHTVDGYTYDPLAARVQDSLSGLAGHGCPRVGNDPWASANDSLRGNNAVGCYFYNPFGSAIDATAGSALYNDPSVKKYYDGLASSVTQVEQAVTEVIFNGDSDMELGGGNVSWAAGYQYRWWDSKYDPTGDNRVDGPQRSPFVFLGVNTNSYIETRVHSFFGELNLPISDVANLEVGVRHEDYGADTVTKPKFAVLWDVTDKTTFRASYEQTFRVPTMPTQETTSLELYAPAGEYIQIKTPVPTALGPEESTNIGFGFIYRPVQGMTVNVDYYSLALEGPFNREAATCVCSVKMTADGTVYDPATDTPQAITSIIAELINGDDVDTAGIDVEVNYSFVSDMGVWSVGGNMNHILEYEVSGAADGSTYDAAGLYNLRSTVLPIEVRSMPDLKMNAYVGLLTDGGVDARLFVRFIDEVKIPSTFDVAATFPNLTSIDDHMTFDFHATKSFMDDSMDVTLSVMNLTDEDPPLTPHELAYDAYTHNPLGRILKVGFKYKL